MVENNDELSAMILLIMLTAVRDFSFLAFLESSDTSSNQRASTFYVFSSSIIHSLDRMLKINSFFLFSK
jgi:hypothetical protein